MVKWDVTHSIDNRTGTAWYLQRQLRRVVERHGSDSTILTAALVGDAQLILLVYGKTFLCFVT